MFVGTELALDEYGPTGQYAPEIPRTFHKAGISCSSTAKQHVKKGADGNEGLDNLRSCLALAKAYDFAGIVPSISKKYMSCTQTNTEIDHELCMRTGESSISSIVELINNANATVTPEEEDALLRNLGRDISQVERDSFEAFCWDWQREASTSYGEFYNSLPMKWRE